MALSATLCRKQDMRRQQRNVNVYLSKTLDIDTKTVSAKEGGKSKGGRKTAYDVARDTKVTPVGGELYRRSLAAITQGKTARQIFRDYKIRKDAEDKKAGKTDAVGAPESSADDGGAKRRGAQAANLTAGDIAQLLLEEEEGGGDGEEDGEEGEEGEEGEDVAA